MFIGLRRFCGQWGRWIAWCKIRITTLPVQFLQTLGNRALGIIHIDIHKMSKLWKCQGLLAHHACVTMYINIRSVNSTHLTYIFQEKKESTEAHPSLPFFSFFCRVRFLVVRLDLAASSYSKDEAEFTLVFIRDLIVFMSFLLLLSWLLHALEADLILLI
jgi:hypothetical protein